MTTARDMIEDAAREVAILGENETMSSGALASGLRRLNRMLDSWRNSKIICYALREESITLVPNKRTYTIGVGGDLVTDRPLQLLSPCFVREGDTDYPVNIISKKGYGSIVSKSTVTSNYPEFLYYDPAYPLGVINLYPVPSAANTLFINSLEPLQNFASATTDLALPPGYEEAIVYNLAIRHAAKKGFAINPETKAIAVSSLAMIKTTNVRKLTASLGIPVGRTGRQYQIEADH